MVRLSLRTSFDAFAITACLAVVAVFVIDAAHERSVASQVALRATENLAESLELQAGETFDATDGALRALAARLRRDGTSTASRAHLTDTIDTLVTTMPCIHSLVIFDEQGHVIAGNAARSEGLLPTIRDRPYFTYHRARRGTDLYISGPERVNRDRTWGLVASRRIDHRDGSFAGIIMASLDVSFFERTYAKLDVGRFGNITLLDDDGTILARVPSIYVGQRFPRAHIFTGPNQFARAGWYTTSSRADGYEHLFAFRRLVKYRVVVRVGVAEAEYLADWQTNTQTKLAGLAFIVTLIGILAVALDIQMGRRKVAEDRLTQLALVDSLTGIANRGQFDEVLEREWRAARRSGQPLALLMIDVDHFKAYNDLYGHQQGDAALVLIAQAISAEVKRSGDLAARYGGEEFVVILRATDASRAVTVAERLRDAVAALGIVHAGSANLHATVSIGIASFVPTLRGTGTALLAAADGALYEAKRTGRNRLAVAAHAITESVEP